MPGPSLQFQPDPSGAPWLPWMLLLLAVLGGLAVFFIYRRQQERKYREIAARLERLHAEDLNLWKLVELIGESSADEALISMLTYIKGFTGAHRAYIYLFDTHQEVLHAIAETGDMNALVKYKSFTIVGNKFAEEVRSKEPLIVEDLLHPDPDYILDPNLIEEGNRCMMIIPIIAEDEVLGRLTLVYADYRSWNAEEMEEFLWLGRIVGTAVRTATRLEQVKELTMLQERRRISQDLHDSFSQLISALSMRSEAAMLTYEEGNFKKIQTDLGRIIETTHEIQGVLRNEMLSLRNIAEDQKDLLPPIRDCIERFKLLSNIPVEFLAQDVESPLIVPSYTGNQFIWVLQECLSNVRRHSNASRVQVTVSKNLRHLNLKVEDDGRGFDQASVSENRLGLQIIRERAQDVGGTIAIHTEIDQGTSIEVNLPILTLKGDHHGA